MNTGNSLDLSGDLFMPNLQVKGRVRLARSTLQNRSMETSGERLEIVVLDG